MDSSFGNSYNTAYGNPEYRDISISQLNRSSFNNGSFNRSGDISARRRNGGANIPNFAPTSMETLPRPAENIYSWFFSQLSKKHWEANKVVGVCSFLAILSLSLLIRLSLWAPVDSITGEFKMVFSISYWVWIFLSTAVLSLAICYFPVQYLFNPANESISSVDRPESKTAFVIFAAISLGLYVALNFITNFSASWIASWTAIAFTVVSILVATAKIATENDFRLYFPDNENIVGWKNLLKAVIIKAQQSTKSNLNRTMFVFRYSVPITFLLCLVFPLLRSNLWRLFDPILIAHVAAFTFVLFLLADLVCFAINRVTMAPLEFPLPTPYFFNNTHHEVVNIVNGMASSNSFIRLFAFNDFWAKSKSPSKSAFFTLSQPGNHPKLWNAILTNCLNVVNECAQKLLKETETILTKNAANLQYAQFLSGDRSTVKATLLKPPTLKPKMPQSKKSFELINMTPIKNTLKPYYDAFYNHFVLPKPIIPTFETDIVVFAIEGLGSLVECSLMQDKYGIVQKSLSIVLSSFIDLASACDQLIRAKSMRRNSASYAEARIFKIRNITVAVINDIYTAFERHIKDLNLPADKLVLLKEFTA